MNLDSLLAFTIIGFDACNVIIQISIIQMPVELHVKLLKCWDKLMDITDNED